MLLLTTPQWKRGVDSSIRCCREASLMVASLVRLAAAWDGRVNMSGQRYCDRSVWEMWRKWDEAEWGLHV